jgi:hypothetical protein
MLQKLGNEIRACYQHADYCHHLAETATDRFTKRHFLAMEERWLSLARGYEFAERLSRFTVPYRKRKRGHKAVAPPLARRLLG